MPGERLPLQGPSFAAAASDAQGGEEGDESSLRPAAASARG